MYLHSLLRHTFHINISRIISYHSHLFLLLAEEVLTMSAVVGHYPEMLGLSFNEAEELSIIVGDECNRRNIEWQKVSKETIKMRDEAEPDYSFHKDLQFTVTVSQIVMHVHLYTVPGS